MFCWIPAGVGIVIPAAGINCHLLTLPPHSAGCCTGVQLYSWVRSTVVHMCKVYSCTVVKRCTANFCLIQLTVIVLTFTTLGVIIRVLYWRYNDAGSCSSNSNGSWSHQLKSPGKERNSHCRYSARS